MKTLLVTVDSLRYDHYQFMENTKTYLGESHDRAFSTATATLGAFPTMMTGRYDVNHRIRPDDSFVTEISETTIGITSNRLVSERYGYDGGFNTFISPVSRGEEDLKDKLAEKVPRGLLYQTAAKLWSTYQRVSEPVSDLGKSFRPGDEIVEEFLQEIEEEDEWFGWLHFMEPHHPYDPEGTELSRAEAQSTTREAIAGGNPSQSEVIRDLYRQEVIEVDIHLEKLWRKIPQDTRIIFAADHGEMLGEDGIWGHPGSLLRPELLHIPFATKNITVDSPVVSFIDIPSLVLGEEFYESGLPRNVAFSSMQDMKCAFNRDHIAKEGGVLTLDGEEGDDPKLERALASFEPASITKQDAIEEDLKALGYLEE